MEDEPLDLTPRPPRPDVALDPPLAAALDEAQAAVRSDLADARWDEALDEAVKERRWWVSQWPAGAEFLACLLAQDLQEAVRQTDPTWPRCTETTCPEIGRHPLFVEPDLGPDPFWVCEKTGLPLAPVGSLPA